MKKGLIMLLVGFISLTFFVTSCVQPITPEPVKTDLHDSAAIADSIATADSAFFAIPE